MEGYDGDVDGKLAGSEFVWSKGLLRDDVGLSLEKRNWARVRLFVTGITVNYHKCCVNERKINLGTVCLLRMKTVNYVFLYLQWFTFPFNKNKILHFCKMLNLVHFDRFSREKKYYFYCFRMYLVHFDIFIL